VEFKIKSSYIENLFYIKLYDRHFEIIHSAIKTCLNIPPHIYYSILSDSGGEFFGEDHYANAYHFRNEEDAQRAIDRIEGYLVLRKLTEE